MDGQMARKFHNTLACGKYLRGQAMVLSCIPFIRQDVYLIFRKAIYFTHFSNDGAILESGISSQQAHMLLAIFIEYISDDIIPFVPTEIHIKIRRVYPIRVNETFKIQIKCDRIHIRNADTISNDRISSRAPAYMMKPFAACIPGNIPGNEVIGGKVHFTYDA